MARAYNKDGNVCGARKKQQYPSPNGRSSPSEFCQRPAGEGTDHLGYGHCRLHLGNTPTNTKAAYLEMAQAEAMKIMGPMIDVSPIDALYTCVRIAAGEVAYTTMKVEELEVDAIARPQWDSEKSGPEGTVREHKEGPHTLNFWITTRHNCLERLAKFSKMALDAGIDERAIAMAEGQGTQLAFAMKSMFDELQLTNEQLEQLPDIIHRHLTVMEKSSMAGINPGSARDLFD
jgi:hypothetical protein